jgi:hypothetical protein
MFMQILKIAKRVLLENDLCIKMLVIFDASQENQHLWSCFILSSTGMWPT